MSAKKRVKCIFLGGVTLEQYRDQCSFCSGDLVSCFFSGVFLLQLSKKNVCFVVSNDVSGAKLSPACPHFFASVVQENVCFFQMMFQ